MPESPQPPTEEVVVLRDPALAAFLAWLIPGLGHLYQGRRAKAALYFVCIMGTFVFGIILGGNARVGWGRTAYFSWRDGDRRLNYAAQIGAGLIALPALVQANRMANHEKVWWGGFMAPPRLPGNAMLHGRDDPNSDQPTLSDLNKDLGRYFELGTVFTMIGGLLNILAIYDAWGGPVFLPPRKKEEEPSDDDAHKKDDAASPKS